MKPLIEYADYRAFLNDLFYGPLGKRGLQSEIAKAMGCQAAYLSQVLKGKAELTEDHAIKLAQHQRFSDFDSDYFLLLLRLARAATPDLRRYLEKKREQLVQESQELSSKVRAQRISSSEKNMSEYFSNWIPSTLHIATSSEKFQTVPALSQRLGLPNDVVESTLRFLIQCRMVELKNGRYVFSGNSFHLPRESALHPTHQTNRRIQALRSIQEKNSESLHFSSVFTATPETFKEVQKLLSQYIETSHRKIHASGSEEVYAMCLDAFQVV